jgi:hypothetical protein
MTMQATITYNGITINLQTGGSQIVDGYYPATIKDTDESVSEQMDLWYYGSNISGYNRSINRALEYARLHNDDDDGVYFNWSIDSSTPTWRTRIINGQVQLDSKLDHRYRRGRALLRLVFLHTPWWEGPEAQTPLTNPNGNNNTTGLRVYNCNDGSGSAPNKRVMYADIAAASVDGDLPGATRLEMTSEYSPDSMYKFWIGQSWHTPASFVPLYEFSGTSNAAASGGAQQQSMVQPGWQVSLGSWTISEATVNAARGQFVKPILRFLDGNTDILLQYSITLLAGSVAIWAGQTVKQDPNASGVLFEFPTFRLPPRPVAIGGLSSLTLTLRAYNPTANNVTVNLDCLYLVPVDGYRKLITSAPVATNQQVVDDGINNVTYVINSISRKIPSARSIGSPITLWPATDQRLYFLLGSNTMNTSPVSASALVKLFYRPRRYNL